MDRVTTGRGDWRTLLAPQREKGEIHKDHMQLHGVIFDMDGTLADTVPLCCAAYRRAFKEHTGREYSDDEIAVHFGSSEEGIIQRVVPERWEACLATYLAAYEQAHASYIDPFPGVGETLRDLRRRGVALAIVTGKGPRSAAISFDRLGLARCFDSVEVGSPVGAIKPLAIRRVLARWNVTPERVAYVGDVPSDIEAAREAGVLPLAAAWAPAADSVTLQALRPVATFVSVEDFLTWIGARVASP
jgi:HAD superfamily hydrolase (TIGR01509 family)